MRKAQIHALAETLAHKVEFKHTDPIEPLVVKLGGRIEYKTADYETDRLPESIVIDAINDFTIFLPSVTAAVRDRFTIAHELGHLFIHFPIVQKTHPGDGMYATRWVDESNPDLIRAEWEANWFAAAFLMPEVIFRSVFRSLNGSLELTSVQFGVSIMAATIRAKTLNLTPGADQTF